MCARGRTARNVRLRKGLAVFLGDHAPAYADVLLGRLRLGLQYRRQRASEQEDAYDAGGNQTSITDANNHTTQFQYDARKRLRKTIYNDTTFTTNTYDNPGNLTAVTDQAGKTVQYTFFSSVQGPSGPPKESYRRSYCLFL